ncbi:MAG: L,D-transpeptidase [Candidatus Latescibacteria bacterium]|nr:L,D-transpeptidase [Candidatus Latescibacterota bacterium]
MQIRRLLPVLSSGFTWVLLAAGACFAACAVPPKHTLEIANRDIVYAEEEGAAQYAPELLEAAKDSLDASFRKIRVEQGEWFEPMRDYTPAFSAALAASHQAQAAAIAALEARRARQTQLEGKFQEISANLQDAFQSIRGLPKHRAYNRNLTKAELILGAAQNQLYRGDLDPADQKILEVANIVNGVRQSTGNYIADYLRGNRDRWSKWAKETVEVSARQGNYALIVDKSSHTCYLYYDGRLKKRYVADLGANWMAKKSMQGDKVTPEGKYRIIGKRQRPDGHKALDLNYPNAEDIKRFNEGKRKGTISRRASIGYAIQIHSGGGRGQDWTAGCVALANPDMDEVFRIVGINTPVTIVGAWDNKAVADSRF